MHAFIARLAIHAGLWLVPFLLLFALSGRPLLSAGTVLAFHVLLILISRAKARVLREPLVFADLGLYLQALRHPRLYLPYFGAWLAAGVAAAFALLVGLGLALERPRPVDFVVWEAALLGAVIVLGAGTRLARGHVALEPGVDLRRFGLLPSLWLYWVAEDRRVRRIESPFAKSGSEPDFPALKSGSDPDLPIVVVQSESFFDARRLGAQVPAEILPRFDARAAEGESGRLSVPVWGAYTMRTEFAFLSGIAPRALGVHRFNPYRRFAHGGAATIAGALKARGYRTLCIHPYAGSFFGRDRVFPGLGFDEFIDLSGFAGACRDGPYIADREITKKISDALDRRGTPTFIFAITMENHGPLRLEGEDELAVYLRHLRNADAMIGELCHALKRKDDGLLCFYGDHVPGLPQVYAASGYDDPSTDYLIWRVAERRPLRADRAVESLGVRLLELAGQPPAPA